MRIYFMNYRIRLRHVYREIIPYCIMEVKAINLSHCSSSLSVFLCPTRSTFPRHTSLIQSLCIPQCQLYGAINTQRRNGKGWCCRWVAAEYEWAWVQRRGEIILALSWKSTKYMTFISSFLKYFPQLGKVYKEIDCLLHTRVGGWIGQ